MCGINVLAACAALLSGQTPPDAAATVAGYAECCRRYETIAVTVECRRRVDRSLDDRPLPPDRIKSVERVRLWRDGNQTRAIFQETKRALSRDGKPVEMTIAHEEVNTPERSLIAPLADGPGKALESNLIARQPKGATRMAVQLVGLSVFGGALELEGPSLGEQLAAATPRASWEKSQGHDAVRLDFESDWGVHTLWLDPARGYHPLHMTQRKSLKHLVAPGRRLEQIKYSDAAISSAETEVVVDALRQAAGAWFASSYSVRDLRTFDKPPVVDDRSELYRVTDISTDPHSGGNAFRFETPIPDGTRVVDDDRPGIAYQWRDGEVVKSVDQAHATSLARQQFKTSFPWWAVVGGALLVACVAAGILWWRRSSAG